MKKLMLAATSIAVLGLGSCGGSSEEVDNLVNETIAIQNEVDEMETSLEEINTAISEADEAVNALENI